MRAQPGDQLLGCLDLVLALTQGRYGEICGKYGGGMGEIWRRFGGGMGEI